RDSAGWIPDQPEFRPPSGRFAHGPRRNAKDVHGTVVVPGDDVALVRGECCRPDPARQVPLAKAHPRGDLPLDQVPCGIPREQQLAVTGEGSRFDQSKVVAESGRFSGFFLTQVPQMDLVLVAQCQGLVVRGNGCPPNAPRQTLTPRPGPAPVRYVP